MTAQATRIIDTHLHDETFRARHLADALGITRDHLSRRLRQATGTNARTLIRMRRLERARTMLRSGRAATVSEVAYAVGYDSLPAFSRAYSQQWGTPPSADLRREALT
jgi:AraC-like DNA-binding protein